MNARSGFDTIVKKAMLFRKLWEYGKIFKQFFLPIDHYTSLKAAIQTYFKEKVFL